MRTLSPARRESRNLTALVLVGFFATLIAGGLGTAGGFVLGLLSADRPAVRKKEPAAPVLNRDDFRKTAIGMTTEQLKERFGLPHATHDYNDRSEWVYRNLVRDEVTGKTDELTTLTIREGRVTDVSSLP